MNFIERIIVLIDNKGISHGTFLRSLKLGKNSIYRWEETKIIPKAETLIKIADYFDVSVDYLLCRTDNKYSHK